MGAATKVLGEGPRRKGSDPKAGGMHVVKIFKQHDKAHEDQVAMYTEPIEDGGRFGATVLKESARAVFVQYPKSLHNQITKEDTAVAERRVMRPSAAGIKGELRDGQEGFEAVNVREAAPLGQLIEEGRANAEDPIEDDGSIDAELEASPDQ